MKYTVTEQLGKLVINKEYEGTPEEIAELLKIKLGVNQSYINAVNVEMSESDVQNIRDIVKLFENIRETSRLGI